MSYKAHIGKKWLMIWHYIVSHKIWIEQSAIGCSKIEYINILIWYCIPPKNVISPEKIASGESAGKNG